MLKLIVTDIDGTLVEDGGNNINPRIFEVVKELKNRGIVFAVCSGRSYTSLKGLFEPVKDDIIFCCENGGLVKCRNYTISESHINIDILKELIKESKNISDIMPCLCKHDRMIVERSTDTDMEWLNNGYKIKTIVVDDLLEYDLDHTIKFSVLDRVGVGKNSGKLFNKKWWDILDVCESGYEWLDMTAKGVSKGKAVSDIQYYLDITKEQTMVFGDNHNDISMMKQAYYSFAVKNAREEVHQNTKFVTKSNNDEGVLLVLDKVLKGDYNFANLV